MSGDTVYDSTADTQAHILRVAELLVPVVAELAGRGVAHDRSKLEPPEKDTFDRYTPRLKGMVYGSDEYKACLVEMGPALDHHYKANRHHPEHFKHGVDDMTLVDLVEMLADWKAAGERHADGGNLTRSLEINAARFHLSPQLVGVLLNTARHLGWLPAG